jgi:hypothetical protein
MTRRALAGVSARGPRFQVRAVPEIARGVSIPAPVQGWDAISPLAAMPETRAVTLDNLFPQPGYVEIRKGHRRHNTLSPVITPVESLMAYHALSTANNKLFAASGTAIYDVTATTTTTIPASLSGLANARWQHINFSTSGGNFLWICNGADVPRTWDGTVWATASVTGITPTDIVHVAAYSERIWMTRKNQISPAYLNTDSIQGAATILDLTGVFNKGGFLEAVGAWSRDGGQGPDDYVAFITSRGEVAIYSGDPSRNFELAGVYEMGAPIGRRCLTKVGPDLAVVCVDGVVPLSRAINTDRAAILNATITAQIQPVMNQSARDWSTLFGWQLTSYARGTRAILNVPVLENGEQRQYVMNTITGAWCRFLDENANCWEIFQDRLFYGGNTGHIVEADCQGFDYDGPIEYNLETAFNYCKNRGRLKDFTMCRSLLLTDGQASAGLALNIDFARNAAIASLSVAADTLALWDVALWDAGVWPETSRVITNWSAVEGEGFVASIHMQGAVTLGAGGDASQPVVFQINGWDLQVIDGAFM